MQILAIIFYCTAWCNVCTVMTHWWRLYCAAINLSSAPCSWWRCVTRECDVGINIWEAFILRVFSSYAPLLLIIIGNWCMHALPNSGSLTPGLSDLYCLKEPNKWERCNNLKLQSGSRINSRPVYRGYSCVSAVKKTMAAPLKILT
jgi:hypothetical protein